MGAHQLQQVGSSWQDVSCTAALVPLGALWYFMVATLLPSRAQTVGKLVSLELFLVVLPTALVWQPTFQTVLRVAAGALLPAVSRTLPTALQLAGQSPSTWLSSWSSGHMRSAAASGMHVCMCTNDLRSSSLSRPVRAASSAGSAALSCYGPVPASWQWTSPIFLYDLPKPPHMAQV